MKTAIAINCIILALLATGDVVVGGSTTVQEYSSTNLEGGGGFVYVEAVSGSVCRTWGDGVWADTDEAFYAAQWARDVEKHVDSMESTSPRWELDVDYWFELSVGIEDGSSKGFSSGTPLGMVWGDIVGADGYGLQKNVELSDDEIGNVAFWYQVSIAGTPNSPLNWFYRQRENTTGTTSIYHTGAHWDETVLSQDVEFYSCSYSDGEMRYYPDETDGVWFTVNGGQDGTSGSLPGTVFGWDDSGPSPDLVTSWDID